MEYQQREKLFNAEIIFLVDIANEWRRKQFAKSENEFNETTITRKRNKLLCAEICRATKYKISPTARTKLYLDVENLKLFLFNSESKFMPKF